MKILIINGPNLNLLGKREPEIYGTLTFEEFLHELKTRFPQVEFQYFQSNVEGELINAIQEGGIHSHGIILNPGGYAHTSVAIHDAIRAINVAVIEVHISNVHARESMRQSMLTAAACVGTISGFGLSSYSLAVQYLMQNKM